MNPIIHVSDGAGYLYIPDFQTDFVFITWIARRNVRPGTRSRMVWDLGPQCYKSLLLSPYKT